MGTASLCLTAIIAMIALVILRINRRDNPGDELTDCDCRTASLLNRIINEGK
jgi:hypothetical protein